MKEDSKPKFAFTQIFFPFSARCPSQCWLVLLPSIQPRLPRLDSHRLASQPNAVQLPPNPCSCLQAAYIMPDALIWLCLYFWKHVLLEGERCGSSVKCQRERLAHPRHPGASEMKVLSQPPCLSTPLQQPWANQILGRIPRNPSRLAYVIITLPRPSIDNSIYTVTPGISYK